jgi:hypothetical protein
MISAELLNSYKRQDIRVFTTVSGRVFIGLYERSSDPGVRLRNPMLMSSDSLSPLIPFFEGECTTLRESVIESESNASLPQKHLYLEMIIRRKMEAMNDSDVSLGSSHSLDNKDRAEMVG